MQGFPAVFSVFIGLFLFSVLTQGFKVPFFFPSASWVLWLQLCVIRVAYTGLTLTVQAGLLCAGATGIPHMCPPVTLIWWGSLFSALEVWELCARVRRSLTVTTLCTYAMGCLFALLVSFDLLCKGLLVSCSSIYFVHVAWICDIVSKSWPWPIARKFSLCCFLEVFC